MYKTDLPVLCTPVFGILFSDARLPSYSVLSQKQTYTISTVKTDSLYRITTFKLIEVSEIILITQGVRHYKFINVYNFKAWQLHYFIFRDLHFLYFGYQCVIMVIIMSLCLSEHSKQTIGKLSWFTWMNRFLCRLATEKFQILLHLPPQFYVAPAV